MSKLLWMALQAAAIGGLTWMFATPLGYEGEKPISPGGSLFLSVILVAFATAVAVNAWDWLQRISSARRRDSRPEPQAPSGPVGQGSLRAGQGDCRAMIGPEATGAPGQRDQGQRRLLRLPGRS
jgi:hypothetical protein